MVTRRLDHPTGAGMNRSLLNVIARHPATPAGVLISLAQAVSPRSLWAQTGIGRDLCLNVNLPTSALTHLLDSARNPVWETVMRRPGLTAGGAVALLRDMNHPAPWTIALARVPDVDDELATAALDVCPSPHIAATALRRATTSEVRHRAALRVATMPELGNDLDRRLMDAYITDYPDRVTHLLDVATDPLLLAQLRAAADPGGHRPVDVDARAARPGNGVRALTHTPDPDRVLHAAALEAAGTNVQLLSEVVNSLRTDPRDRLEAIRRLVCLPDARAHLTKAGCTALSQAVQTGPVQVACTFLRHAATLRDLHLIRDRDDLPPDALEDVLRVVSSAHPDTQRLWWAVWLTLCPEATCDQHDRARTLIDAAVTTAPVARRAGEQGFTRVLAHLRQHAGAPVTVDDLDVGLAGALTEFPGGTVLLNTYLSGVLPELPAHAGPALGALTPTFPGTIRELFTTIGAVVQ